MNNDVITTLIKFWENRKTLYASDINALIDITIIHLKTLMRQDESYDLKTFKRELLEWLIGHNENTYVLKLDGYDWDALQEKLFTGITKYQVRIKGDK